MTDPGCTQANANEYYDGLPDTCDIILTLRNNLCPVGTWAIGGTLHQNNAANSPSVQYDPVAPTGSPFTFTPASSDSTGAVFGFQYKHSSTVRGAGDDLDRYLLKKDSITSRTLVMNDVWPKNVLHYRDNGDMNDMSKLYLAVNLRRTQSTDLLLDTTRVVTIKLKYFNHTIPPPPDPPTPAFNTGYIQFDSAATGYTAQPRGYMDNALSPIASNSPDPTEFVIRRNMLPSGSTNRRDVTLSAFFRAMNNSQYSSPSPNPLFYVKDYYFSIDSMDIEVYYHGQTDISLDWIRVETPHARKLLRGQLDSGMTWLFKAHLDSLKNYNIRTGKQIKVVRVYGVDEFGTVDWRSHRYLNKLFNGLMETESGIGETKMFEHLTGNAGYWKSSTFRPHGSIANPIVPTTFYGPTDFWKTLGLQWGYLTYSSDSLIRANTVERYKVYNGSYETFLLNSAPISSINHQVPDSVYYNTLITTESFQGWLERRTYEENESPELHMMYSNKPWWGQIWQAAYINVPKVEGVHRASVSAAGPRINTGEELRLMIWQNILRGAKGLMYDRAYSQPPPIPTTEPGAFGFVGFTSGTGSAESTWGGDFFSYPADSSGWHDAIQYDTVAKYSSQPLNNLARIYIGRKSHRLIAKRANDWVTENENELMRLRLVSWYSKGFRTHQNGDTSLLTSLLRLPPVAWVGTNPDSLTRPVWRQHPEPWDSAFVDYTILRDTSQSIGTVFYVGVLNKRTNPLTLVKAYGDSTPMPYFTVASEHDEYSRQNPAVRYIQGGARSITIPFDSVDRVSSMKSWVTYHVREVGQVDSAVTPIDTVIRQGANLSAKFMPGEGKLFRVTVVTQMPIAGDLGHSNQRKLVAFPIQDTNGEDVRDTVRYHLTYHRIRTDGKRSPAKGVYYRRSLPTPRSAPYESINWEPQEICLTNQVEVPGRIDTADCAYPSIVVRKDEEGTPYVYVVFGCVDLYAPAPYQNITEAVFTANTPLQVPGISMSIGGSIGSPSGFDYAQWGTPMVNASASGNYYTWADSSRGIGVGYKAASTRRLTDTLFLRVGLGGSTFAKHPSLNSYSRIGLGEDDCALVWQELTTGDPATSSIYYSRIGMQGGTLTAFLPAVFPDPAKTVTVNGTNTIATISDDLPATGTQGITYEYSYPTVYRGVEDCEAGCTNLLTANWDRVYWQGYDWTDRGVPCNYPLRGAPAMVLYNRIIDMGDSITTGTTRITRDWWVLPTRKIWNSTEHLTQPNVSQGSIYKPTFFTNYSDSAVILNFKSTFCSSTGLGRLWNMPHGYWSFLMSDYQHNAGNNAKVIALEGNLPHLAATPDLRTIQSLITSPVAIQDYRRNRRVFEPNTGNPPSIVSLAQYFMRESGNSQSSFSFIGFRAYNTPSGGIIEGNTVSNDSNVIAKLSQQYYITTPIATSESGQEVTIPFIREHDSVITHANQDTLVSTWVSLSENTQISFFGLGSDVSQVKLLIETASGSLQTEVEIVEATDTSAAEMFFVTPASDQYRIKLINTGNASVYSEETVIGSLPLTDIQSARQRLEAAYEDARNKRKSLTVTRKSLTCSLSPNPAQDVIRVTIQGTALHEPVRMVVSTLLGETVRVVEARTMEETEVSLQGLPSGQYILRSALTRSEFYDPVIIPFVIER